MRIVVVDDILDFGNVVARALEGTPHEVTAVLSPEALPRVLRKQGFDLAFVDMDFYYADSRQTGLTALRHLTEHAVRAIIYSLDSEDNRLLFLLAAFQFYDPLTLLSKGEGSYKIRHLIDLIDQGQISARIREQTVTARRAIGCPCSTGSYTSPPISTSGWHCRGFPAASRSRTPRMSRHGPSTNSLPTGTRSCRR